jgi:hypothetical protein
MPRTYSVLDYGSLCELEYVHPDDYAALAAERDRLAKDAERYRWLRQGILVTDIPEIEIFVRAEANEDDEAYSVEVDAAIDAAMQEKRDE